MGQHGFDPNTMLTVVQNKRELVANGSCLRVVNTITYSTALTFSFLIYEIGFLGLYKYTRVARGHLVNASW